MNNTLKSLLLAAKDVVLSAADVMIPGAHVLIGGVQKLLDKNNTNNSDAINDIAAGTIVAIKSLKGDEVKDPLLLQAGLDQIESGFDKVKAAIR